MFSCEKELLQQSQPSELAVVEAYLYEGEIIDDIYITSLLPYGGEDTIFQKISNADIKILHNGNSYQLTPSDSSGYYHYSGIDLEISIGEKYEIEIEYFNKIITAETNVPVPPSGLSISDSIISIDPNNIKAYWENMTPIDINWDECGSDYSYVLIENVEDGPIDIYSGGKASKGFKRITLPVQRNSYTFMPLEIIQQYGTHLIRVFRINQEYADLYESMEQDSRDLNEPLTNITNGLGIFTAFSCDSLYFEVTQK